MAMQMPTLGPRRASNLSTGSGSGSGSHHGHGQGQGYGLGTYNSHPGSSTSARSSPAASPAVYPSHPSNPSHLPLPSAALSTASVNLERNASTSSQRSALSRNNSRGRGMIPSPRLSAVALGRGSDHGSNSGTAPSSNSGSRNSSFIAAHTPRLLTRRSSEKHQYGHGVVAGLLRSGSGRKGKEKERVEDDLPTAGSAGVLASESQEIIETDQAHMSRRNPETGYKNINQYTIMGEVGKGTHGQVRLGWEMNHELAAQLEEGEERTVQPSLDTGTYWAIKMVDRVPKNHKLRTLRKGALGRSEGGKMVAENEIRREIAIFKKVHHPNVVRMKEIIDDPEQSKLFMIMEYCEGGEIKWQDGQEGPALTVAETRRIFRETVLGLEYLHHQGIIHRDIKPSNLLRTADGTVKISDFGCSHYSEALRVASSDPDHADRYVDDIELAKTAGSPAFFAPEMCYSGIDDEVPSAFKRDSLSSQGTPQQELPGFTLRPPSIAGQDSPLQPPMSPGTFPLKPTFSNDSARRPMSVRSHSSATTFKRDIPRMPITNAIDVWALGVTLYCLLFGRPPFYAANEYLLMQSIPVAEFEIPETMGSDRIPTRSAEAAEAIDLLRKLLAKSASQRMTLDQAKRHPFTTRDLADPETWLLRTDPHAQTFVTVSSQEIAAAVAPSQSFRDKVVSRLRTMAHRLHLGGGQRTRSKSTGQHDTDAGGGQFRVMGRKQRSRDESPMPSPHPGHGLSHAQHQIPVSPQAPAQAQPHLQVEVPKRMLHFGIRSAGPSPSNQSTIQLGSPPLPPVTSVDDVPIPRKGSMPSSGKSGFLVRSRPNPIVLPNKPQLVPLADERSPTKMASVSSLDKYKHARSISPPMGTSMQRRSSDIDVVARQRAPSNASSSGMMGKLSSFIQRTASNRSKIGGGRQSRASVASEDDHAVTIASESPSARRISVDGRSATSQDIDRETFASSSYSSHRMHSPGPGSRLGSGSGSASASRSGSACASGSGAEMAAQWTSRLPHPAMMASSRRNSSPVTPFARHMGAGTSVEGLQGGNGEEELDWLGSTSDSSDSDGGYDTTPGPRSTFGGSLGLSSISPAAPNFTEQWRQVLGQTDGALPTPVATAPNLETVPDASPPTTKEILKAPALIRENSAEQRREMDLEREREREREHGRVSPIAQRRESPVSPTGSMRMRLSTSPTNSTGLHGEWGYSHGHSNPHARSASSGRSRAGSSPWRQQFDEYRARSPLGRLSDDEGDVPGRSLIDDNASSASHSASVSISSSPARAPSLAAGQFSSGSAIGTHPTTPTHSNMYTSGLISPLDLGAQGNPINSIGAGLGMGAIHSPSAPGTTLAHAQPHVVQPVTGNGDGHGHAGRSHVEADDEGGLNISFGSRKGRGRKGSVMRSGSAAPSRTESPLPPMPGHVQPEQGEEAK